MYKKIEWARVNQEWKQRDVLWKLMTGFNQHLWKVKEAKGIKSILRAEYEKNGLEQSFGMMAQH